MTKEPFAFIERDNIHNPYPTLVVGKEPVRSFMDGYEDCELADRIDSAHDAAVKEAVEAFRARVLKVVDEYTGMSEAARRIVEDVRALPTEPEEGK